MNELKVWIPVLPALIFAILVLPLSMPATAAAQEGRVGESICGEPEARALALVWSLTFSDGTTRYSAHGPIQQLWTNYSGFAEVLGLVASARSTAAGLGLAEPKWQDENEWWEKTAAPRLRKCSATYQYYDYKEPRRVTVYVLPYDLESYSDNVRRYLRR